MGVFQNLIVVIFVTLLSSCLSFGSIAARNRRKDFLEKLSSYNFFVPPNFDSPDPVVIVGDLYVNSIDSVNEANMEFTVGIMLYLEWHDSRLIDIIKDETFDYIELDSQNMADFWVPDIYFPNEKRASFHNVMTSNRMIRLHKNDSINFSVRLSLTLSCPMDLRRYPFDKQHCDILIESFGYTKNQLILRWNEETEAVLIKNGLELPQFQIQGREYSSIDRYHRFRGDHSALKATFYMVRNINYYVIQMYVPTFLIVMLSWVSFWLNVNSVPGRVNLGVLSVLTISTQSSSVNRTLPRVSYTKAIDIWMATCLVFVVAALVEFAIANVVSRKGTGKSWILIQKMFRMPGNNTRDISKQLSKDSSRSNLENMCEVARQRDLGEKSTVVSMDGSVRLTAPYPSIMENSMSEETPSKKKLSRNERGSLYAWYLDVASRVLFPVAFGLFNLIYWVYYLNLMIT